MWRLLAAVSVHTYDFTVFLELIILTLEAGSSEDYTVAVHYLCVWFRFTG